MMCHCWNTDRPNLLRYSDRQAFNVGNSFNLNVDPEIGINNERRQRMRVANDYLYNVAEQRLKLLRTPNQQLKVGDFLHLKLFLLLNSSVI